MTFVFPEDGALMVTSPDAVMIEFDEAMDPDSAAGQVTLSTGTLGALDWISETSLMVAYSGIPQATRFTVTLGAGLKDVAGNGLAAHIHAHDRGEIQVVGLEQEFVRVIEVDHDAEADKIGRAHV